MPSVDFTTLARALRAELPDGPQVIQAEKIVWRRIVERCSALLPERARLRFLETCNVPRHLMPGFLAREATSEALVGPPSRQPRTFNGEPDRDPAVAALVVEELRAVHGMTDSRLRTLDPRRRVRPRYTVDGHLHYLAKVDKPLRADQLLLARRLDACLQHRRSGKPWTLASRLAKDAYPATRALRRLQ